MADEQKPVTMDQLKKGIVLTAGHFTVLVVSGGKSAGKGTGSSAQPGREKKAAGGARK